jgi:uncharacterized membrane protein
MVTTITAFSEKELEKRITDSLKSPHMRLLAQGVRKTHYRETHWAKFEVTKKETNK